MSQPTPLRVLHFADAHIDMVTTGKLDPETGLPIRVMDFLRSLDQIVATAIDPKNKIDLVVFAGDAYKDRNPKPTFQREWGKRIMQLSAANIPTILLVGNHDVSPATGRAHTLHEFSTLSVPNIHVGDKIRLFDADELGIPAQVITVPWVSRSNLIARKDMANKSFSDILNEMDDILKSLVQKAIEAADPNLPLILTAHANADGATVGSERSIMLGTELKLGGKIIRDKRLDYVALGHIHKHQELNKGSHPPAVFSGSIERIDFGEWKEDKGYVIAEMVKGKTEWTFHKLKTRRFLSYDVGLKSADSFMSDIIDNLPDSEKVADAIVRVRLSYPQDWEPLLNEADIYTHLAPAFKVQIYKDRTSEKRSRLGDTASVETMSPDELLGIYWNTIGLDEKEAEAMQALARDVLADEVIV